MILFADTEFADFESLDPLSVALVSEDGSLEFYAEILDCESPPSDFVKKTVLPLMQGGEARCLYSEASERLAAWLSGLPSDSIQIVVDYGGDWIILNEMLNSAGCAQKPSAIMLFPAFEQTCLERGASSLLKIQSVSNQLFELMEPHFLEDPRRHHALVDARATRLGWARGMRLLLP